MIWGFRLFHQLKISVKSHSHFKVRPFSNQIVIELVSTANEIHNYIFFLGGVQDDPKLLDDSGEVPKLNGVIGGSILGREIVSLLDQKLVRWLSANNRRLSS